MTDRPEMARSRRRLGQVSAIVVLGLVVVVPLVRMASVALAELGEQQPGSGRAAWNTAWTAVTVTVLAVVGGTLAALATERSAMPGRRWLRIALLLPLLVPPFVSALSWDRAYGPGGLTDDLAGITLPGLFGPAGVVLVLAVHVMPLAYAVVAAGLASRAEPDLVRAARVAGAGPAAAFLTVTAPLLRPSLAAAAALTFVAAINSFGIPAILGIPAGFLTVTTQIYRDLAFSADPAAFARALLLATGLALGALVVVGLADQLLAGFRAAIRTSSPAGGSIDFGSGNRTIASVLWGYLLLTSGVPLVALLLTALTRAVGLLPTPNHWTLANFGEAMNQPFLDAMVRSAALAAIAATGVVALGALLVALRRGRLGRWLGTAALLTFAVPGSTLAVAMLLAYGRWLRDTVVLILVAYVAKFWALGHRTLVGAVDTLPPDLMRAARVSGANSTTTLRTVTIPLVAPAVAAAWALTFLFGLHELTMSSLLYGPGTETLAVVILNLQQIGDVTVTAALAVILTAPVLVGAVVVLAGSWGSSRVAGFE